MRELLGSRISRLGPFAMGLALLLLLAGCDRGGASEDALDFLTQTEGTQYEGQEVPRERVAELQGQIEEYEEDVEEVVRKVGRVAVFRKLLAEEFLDQEMYGPALENLQAALELQPANKVLFYLAGVSSAQTGQVFLANPERRDQYLRQAESYYLRALELDSRYRECLYALSVLYVFELDEPREAEPYLGRLLDIDPGNTRARFLRARMLLALGQVEEAAELYGDLADEAPTREQRNQALENRQQLLERRN